MNEALDRKLGKYEILGEIGKGGFATVYRARDPDLDRVVALKVLDPLLTRDPVWVARFRREARAVARLDHPHVVTIYEVGEAEGLLYIAARLVEGGHLGQRLAQQGPFAWSDVVRLVGEIASALDYAHDQGVIHRDLKAANVLLDEERGALLTDFGFASIVSESSYSISVSGGVVGTPQYIAPEVWEGEPATARTDVYALGCIVYEMVMGQHLFQGDTTPAVMRAHFKPLELPEAWPEGVPPGLAGVLERALAKEPAARFNRAGDLAQALAELKEDTLAAPYAALEAAVAAETWEEALALSRQIQADAPDYRDVAALEEQALEGRERAARAREAATWREEAEQALAEGDLRGAEMAAKRWEALTPDNEEAIAFRERLTAPLEPVDPPLAPGDHAPALVSDEQALQSPVRQVSKPPDTSARRTAPVPSEPANGYVPQKRERTERRRSVPRWVWALGGIALLAILIGVAAVWSGGAKQEPTPEFDIIRETRVVVEGENTRVIEVEVVVTPAPISRLAEPSPVSEATTEPTTRPEPTRTPMPTNTPMPSATLSPSPTPTSTRKPSSAYPGGGRIAFVSRRDGNSEIYVMNADGSEQTNLTNSPESDGGFSWSPDGGRIAFSSRRSGNSQIYVMNADGSGVTRLTDLPGGGWGALWSPDGTFIAFTSYGEREEDEPEIYVVKADGSGLRNLTDNPAADYSPTWSPDSDQIAFVSDRSGNAEIYTISVDGSDLVNLTNNPSEDSDPAWSPDGKRIAFRSWRDRNYELYAMNTDGSGVTRLTKDSNYDEQPAWSPDGKRIAFASRRSGYYQIYTMKADGSGLIRVTKRNRYDLSPRWSPDGERIVFESYLTGENVDIWVVNADGSELTRLTDNPEYDEGADWMP